MKVKTVAKQSAVLQYPDKDQQEIAIRAPWRLAYDLMQPWSVCDNPRLGCECPAPNMHRHDCPWHGDEAMRVCFAP